MTPAPRRRQPTRRNGAEAADPGLRLNRFLARAGHGSRRSVEALITAGRVTVDGEKVTDLGRRVVPGRHEVAVDGQRVSLPDDHRVYAFHKPLGVVCTLRVQGDQNGLLPYRHQADLPDRFMPVGRLDADSSGLLLWTDDGDLSQALQRPTSGVWKRYEVVLTKLLAPGAERTLAGGDLILDGRPIRRCRVQPDPEGDRRRWTLELHEGRKRQIRRMFAAVGARVSVLVRTAVGPIELGRLQPGGFRRLDREQEQALRRAVHDASDV